MPPLANSELNFASFEILENKLDVLRGHLESCDSAKVSSQLILECATQDLLGTCEQLLAFQLYDEFQKLQKKKEITELQLMDCSSTRHLYLGFLEFRKNGKKQSKVKASQNEKRSSSEVIRDLQRERSRIKKFAILKIVGIILTIILLASTAFKLRPAIVKLLKMILNIK